MTQRCRATVRCMTQRTPGSRDRRLRRGLHGRASTSSSSTSRSPTSSRIRRRRPRRASWVLNAYAIVVRRAARAGRPLGRPARPQARLPAGLAVFTVAPRRLRRAPSVEALVAARVLQAVGAALMLPTSLGAAAARSRRQRAVAVALLGGGRRRRRRAGPPIGGLLVEADWRWVFLVNLPVGIAALVVGARVLREVREPAPARPDLLGAVLLAAGVGALVARRSSRAPELGLGRAAGPRRWSRSAALLASSPRRARGIRRPSSSRRSCASARSASRVAALLFFAGFGAMLLRRPLPHRAWGGRPAGRAEIAPGPATAAVFACRARGSPGASARRGRRARARPVRRWRRVVADPARAAPDYAAMFLPGDADRRRRRRARDPDPDRGGGLVAAAGALRHRHRPDVDGPPARRRRRRRALVALLGDAQTRRTSTRVPFMLAASVASGIVLAGLGPGGRRPRDPGGDGMTGLELLEAIQTGDAPPPGFAVLLDLGSRSSRRAASSLA